MMGVRRRMRDGGADWNLRRGIDQIVVKRNCSTPLSFENFTALGYVNNNRENNVRMEHRLRLGKCDLLG